MEEFLGRTLRRMEGKPLFEIMPDCVGDENAEWLGLQDERQGFLQLLLRPDVSRNRREVPDLLAPPLPVTPHRKNQGGDRQRCQHPHHPPPAIRYYHWRLDVANVIRHRGRLWNLVDDVCRLGHSSSAAEPALFTILKKPAQLR